MSRVTAQQKAPRAEQVFRNWTGHVLRSVDVSPRVSPASLLSAGFINDETALGKDEDCVWPRQEPPPIKMNRASATGETNTEPPIKAVLQGGPVSPLVLGE